MNTDFLSRDIGVPYRSSDRRFISIDMGGIDEPPVGLQQSSDRVIAFLVRKAVGAKPIIGIS